MTGATTNGFNARLLGHALRQIKDCGAFKVDVEKGFRLKLHEMQPDAPRSPFYWNLRIPSNKGSLSPDAVASIAQLMYFSMQENKIRFDALCGIPRAGEPFAWDLKHLILKYEKNTVPIITLEKEEMGDRRRIGKVKDSRGAPSKGTVLLVDDLITGAETKEEAIDALRKEGYIVKECLVFLDREQGGRQKLEKLGVYTHSIMSIRGALMTYRDEGVVTPEEFEVMYHYVMNNLPSELKGGPIHA